jgi:AAA-like domain
MRQFNTSGPNNPSKHYTLLREDLVQQGIQLVHDERYFTIWAPRQTGKSTYFLLLKTQLEKENYQVLHLNLENFQNCTLEDLFRRFQQEFELLGIEMPAIQTFAGFSNFIASITAQKLVLICDEVEGLNPALFGQFLHTIRNLYHFRDRSALKSTILVGVSNIVGLAEDNASPFNIAETLNIPYFTDEETTALLAQHETESGQSFERKVVEKISEITANQPGLVNGFAYQLVKRFAQKPIINYADYLTVEQWYLNEAIDKNFANILKHAKEQRAFLETLLFTEQDVPFNIDREAIKVLHTNGLIRKDAEGLVEFWVPYYKKRLHNALYPYTNGEKSRISGDLYAPEFFTADGNLNIEKLIDQYKQYVKRRGFGVFREKDEQGNFTSIKEAGLIYSFETYIAAFVAEAEGKSYREADTGLGKSDLILNIRNQEFLIETKKYYSPNKFLKGKEQLAYYAKSLGLKQAVYLVFAPNHLQYPAVVAEGKEVLRGVEIMIFLVGYDEEKDF